MSLKLIEEYQRRVTLWDSDDKHHRNLTKRGDLWQEIADQFTCNVLEIRKKLGSLLASYRRERLKEIRQKPWKSKWFAFNSMRFLNGNKSNQYGCQSDPLNEPNDVSIGLYGNPNKK